MVANVPRVKAIQELERAIVECQSQDAHVIGVHDAMTKTNCLPLSHQISRSDAHLFQERCIGVGRCEVLCFKVMRNDEVCQLFQMLNAIG